VLRPLLTQHQAHFVPAITTRGPPGPGHPVRATLAGPPWQGWAVTTRPEDEPCCPER